MKLDVDDLDKIWEKVLKREPDDCWFWQGSVDKNGYGLLYLQGRTVRAARALWQLLHDIKLKESHHVLHSCDNPPCMNPAHLFLGTHAQNMADMVVKGRSHHPIGALNGRWIDGRRSSSG